jgi:UDP-GlcNAc:undecaprenyl-phosphate GlcNAc-1-phosphate transferase
VNSPWAVLLILVGAGAVSEWVALTLLLRVRPPPLLSRNYRQAEVVNRGGATFAAPLAAGVALAMLLPGSDPPALGGAGVGALLFGVLGWLDDAYGTPGVRGLKGHLLRLIRRRQVTTGLIKAVGGAAVGLWAAHLLGAPGWAIVPAGAVIALSANTVNVLDVRPGRAVKLFAASAVIIMAFAWAPPVPAALAVLAVLLGAVLAFAPADLRERVMLGDTGANPLGAVLGMSVVAVAHWPTWLALVAALFAFCTAADRWSLTAALERTAILRWLDELGRPNTRDS